MGLKTRICAPGNCSAFVATGDYTKHRGIVMGHNNWTNYAVGSRGTIPLAHRRLRGEESGRLVQGHTGSNALHRDRLMVCRSRK